MLFRKNGSRMRPITKNITIVFLAGLVVGNLSSIIGNNYISSAQADVGGKGQRELIDDPDFRNAVEEIIFGENCSNFEKCLNDKIYSSYAAYDVAVNVFNQKIRNCFVSIDSIGRPSLECF